MCVGYIPVELSMSTVDDSENNHKSNLTFLKRNDPESTFTDFLSIFDPWGHMRTLCSPTGPPDHNTPISRSLTRGEF